MAATGKSQPAATNLRIIFRSCQNLTTLASYPIPVQRGREDALAGAVALFVDENERQRSKRPIERSPHVLAPYILT